MELISKALGNTYLAEKRGPGDLVGRPALFYARHGRYLGGGSPLRALTWRTASRAQRAPELRERERAWGGSRRAKPGLDGQELRKEAWDAG